MNNQTVLFDANIFYSAPMRDIFMQLAMTDIFRAKWSEDIHREWIDSLIRNQPERDRAVLERTRDLMNQEIRDCLVINYEKIIPSLELPDPDDRHVLAAAIVSCCDIIVTQNLKDFPENVLKPHGIELVHPDDFLCNHLALTPDLFCFSLYEIRARLRNPPFTPEEYLENLCKVGLIKTVAKMEKFKDKI